MLCLQLDTHLDSVLKGGWDDNVNEDDNLRDSDMIGQVHPL